MNGPTWPRRIDLHVLTIPASSGWQRCGFVESMECFVYADKNVGTQKSKNVRRGQISGQAAVYAKPES